MESARACLKNILTKLILRRCKKRLSERDEREAACCQAAIPILGDSLWG